MSAKRIAPVLLALAVCCAIVACANPAAPAEDPVRVQATPLAAQPDPPLQSDDSGSSNNEEETSMESIYNGILVELETREDGTVDLVMVPQGTPLEDWGDPMNQFIFHTGPETCFATPPGELPEGGLLTICHKGIATRSIPPQGVALEVRPMDAQ